MATSEMTPAELEARVRDDIANVDSQRDAIRQQIRPFEDRVGKLKQARSMTIDKALASLDSYVEGVAARVEAIPAHWAASAVEQPMQGTHFSALSTSSINDLIAAQAFASGDFVERVREAIHARAIGIEEALALPMVGHVIDVTEEGIDELIAETHSDGSRLTDDLNQLEAERATLTEVHNAFNLGEFRWWFPTDSGWRERTADEVKRRADQFADQQLARDLAAQRATQAANQ